MTSMSYAPAQLTAVEVLTRIFVASLGTHVNKRKHPEHLANLMRRTISLPYHSANR